ncbi:unnamed protein product [Amoebophrya sp. A25]|nr:unnamed protein product [Amoebophrya sp. A25]|eukprot:GSA25T00011775001.1
MSSSSTTMLAHSSSDGLVVDVDRWTLAMDECFAGSTASSQEVPPLCGDPLPEDFALGVIVGKSGSGRTRLMKHVRQLFEEKRKASGATPMATAAGPPSCSGFPHSCSSSSSTTGKQEQRHDGSVVSDPDFLQRGPPDSVREDMAVRLSCDCYCSSTGALLAKEGSLGRMVIIGKDNRTPESATVELFEPLTSLPPRSSPTKVKQENPDGGKEAETRDAKAKKLVDLPLCKLRAFTGLDALQNVGLNKIPTWMRKAYQLSNGERSRFELAKMLRSDVDIDDFASVVDKYNAWSMSFSLSRCMQKHNVRRVLVTISNPACLRYLQPDFAIKARSGQVIANPVEKKDRKLTYEWSTPGCQGWQPRDESKGHQASWIGEIDDVEDLTSEASAVKLPPGRELVDHRRGKVSSENVTRKKVLTSSVPFCPATAEAANAFELPRDAKQSDWFTTRQTIHLPQSSHEVWNHGHGDLSVISVVGPSGSGKTSSLSEFCRNRKKIDVGFSEADKLSRSRAVISVLGDIVAGDSPHVDARNIVGGLLNLVQRSLLLRSSALLLPYACLSTSEQDRVELAALILQGLRFHVENKAKDREGEGKAATVLIDEFTSHLERKTAEAACLRLGKYLRTDRWWSSLFPPAVCSSSSRSSAGGLPIEKGHTASPQRIAATPFSDSTGSTFGRSSAKKDQPVTVGHVRFVFAGVFEDTLRWLRPDVCLHTRTGNVSVLTDAEEQKLTSELAEIGAKLAVRRSSQLQKLRPTKKKKLPTAGLAVSGTGQRASSAMQGCSPPANIALEESLQSVQQAGVSQVTVYQSSYGGSFPTGGSTSDVETLDQFDQGIRASSSSCSTSAVGFTKRNHTTALPGCSSNFGSSRLYSTSAEAATDAKKLEDERKDIIKELKPRPLRLSLKRVKDYHTARHVWDLHFEPHHYLDGKLAKNSHSFLLRLYDYEKKADIPVGLIATQVQPGIGMGSISFREHRLVVLPEFQGLGIGVRVSDTLAQCHIDAGLCYTGITAHPRLGGYRDSKDVWAAKDGNGERHEPCFTKEKEKSRKEKKKEKLEYKEAHNGKSPPRKKTQKRSREEIAAEKAQFRLTFRHLFLGRDQSGNLLDGNRDLQRISAEACKAAIAKKKEEEETQAKRNKHQKKELVCTSRQLQLPITDFLSRGGGAVASSAQQLVSGVNVNRDPIACPQSGSSSSAAGASTSAMPPVPSLIERDHSGVSRGTSGTVELTADPPAGIKRGRQALNLSDKDAAALWSRVCTLKAHDQGDALQIGGVKKCDGAKTTKRFPYTRGDAVSRAAAEARFEKFRALVEGSAEAVADIKEGRGTRDTSDESAAASWSLVTSRTIHDRGSYLQIAGIKKCDGRGTTKNFGYTPGDAPSRAVAMARAEKFQTLVAKGNASGSSSSASGLILGGAAATSSRSLASSSSSASSSNPPQQRAEPPLIGQSRSTFEHQEELVASTSYNNAALRSAASPQGRGQESQLMQQMGDCNLDDDESDDAPLLKRRKVSDMDQRAEDQGALQLGTGLSVAEAALGVEHRGTAVAGQPQSDDDEPVIVITSSSEDSSLQILS